MKNSNNIICSTSSGYTSVMMAIKMKEWYPECNVINVMANTGKEDIRSLEFMNECDKYFGLNLVWLEAFFHEKGKGNYYKITTFKDLCTNGDLFEQGIKKYGIPSVANKWCNRELKLVPMTKYANDIFGKNNWSVAIGIRTDEIDRISENYKTNNIFYPPFEHGINQKERNKFWKDKPIKLKLKAYEGNCDVCFEKSNRKKMTIAVENPEKLIWWDEMEKKYSLIPIDGKKVYNSLIEKGGYFFGRGNKSIQELIKDSKKPFKKATDEYIYENDLFDLESDCGQSCSIFK
jgi:hypothetical protein